MSTSRFLGIMLIAISLQAQSPPAPPHDPFGAYSGFPLMASGDSAVADEFSITSDRAPISGVVSLHELQHSIPRKALREAYEAQKLARKNRIADAIAKLEDAIRIAPQYRDAHVNLGVQYARAGRPADARAQFETALSIGPPLSTIYFDLAIAAATLNQPLDAETYAAKALDLNPADTAARRLVQLIREFKYNATK